jgi:hypothetical protein
MDDGGGMEYPDDLPLSCSPAIHEGIRRLELHPEIEEITHLAANSDTGGFNAVASVRVRLPSEWAVKGVSPKGVMQLEPVTFSFPHDYPIHAPDVQLRQDFNRSLPHIQPGLSTEPVVPCIYEGNMDELFHAEGLWAIVQQLIDWLEKAARDELINPSQGWEPIRRDSLQNIVVADSSSLRSLVSRKESYHIFNLLYLKILLPHSADTVQPYSLHGQITGSVQVTKFTFSELFREVGMRSRVMTGHSIAVVVTPGKLPCGKLVVANQYKPEDISNLAELRLRAAEYGCDQSLNQALNWLQQRAKGCNSQTAKFPIILVLCARRPINLIGQSSNIELIPYLLEIAAPQLLQDGDQTRVFAVSHREAITPTLLQEFSGEKLPPKSHHLALIGCGSLGSKIAIHMARSGTTPTSVIDKSFLSPHNATRHALLPGMEAVQLSWVDAKAQALAYAIEGLGQTTKPYKQDVTLVAHDPKRLQQLFPAKTWAIVNTTASLAVREAIAAVPVDRMKSRVIETCLFGNGTVGMLNIEGFQRNPNGLDLIAETYEAIRTNKDFRAKVFEGEDPIYPHAIGQGCSSATMVIPDSRISIWAASIAQGITALRSQGLPESTGRILLGQLTDDGMGLNWISIDVPPVHIIPIDNTPWTIRLSERAHQKILEECAAYSEVETGGILVGRISDTMRAFLVTDVLAAPLDSKRSPNNFTLGVEGVHAQLKLYTESCHSALYSLGTWHSHLSDSGPSLQDKQTAAVIGFARPAPSVLLIKTLLRYRAILASSESLSLIS